MTARRLTLTPRRADTAGAVDIDIAMPSPFGAWSWPQGSTSRPWAVGVVGESSRVLFGTTETEQAARAAAVQLYLSWLAGGVILGDLAQRRLDHLALIPLLAGRDLACRCALDVPCHGDALLVLATGVSPRVLVEDLAGAA